jgi:hypothetical protein
MAKKRVWRHSNDFRRMAVERFNSCENIVALAKKLGIQRRLLYKWREDFEVADSFPYYDFDKSFLLESGPPSMHYETYDR